MSASAEQAQAHSQIAPLGKAKDGLDVMASYRALDWVLMEPATDRVSPGDLVSREAGGMPIYKVEDVADGLVRLRVDVREQRFVVLFRSKLKQLSRVADVLRQRPRELDLLREDGALSEDPLRLALVVPEPGLARYLIEHRFIDERYLAAHTSGFEAFRAHVEPYTLAVAERESGIASERIEQLAQLIHAGRRVSFCRVMLNSSCGAGA